MNKLVYFLFITLACVMQYADAQVIRFKGTYGGISHDYGYSARQTFDNGYIALGSTSSYSSSTDVYLFKTDSIGKMKWFKNIGGNTIDVGRCIQQTKDSGYVICGYTNSLSNGYDVLLIKTDRYGDTTWTKKYGGTNWDFGYYVQQTYDDGFIITGGTYSYGAGDEDVYLIKTDANGDTLWTRTFGGAAEDEGRSVIQATPDSGFVIAGYTKSFSDTLGNAYIVKTDRNGDSLWTKKYGGIQEDYLMDIKETTFFNGYVAVGGTRSFGPDEDVYMMRMQYNGDTLWTKAERPTGSNSDDAANAVAISAYDNTFTFIGYTTGATLDDVYFLKFDGGGNWIGATGYGTSGHDIGYSISPTRDKGFIVCGQTDTTAGGFALPNVLLVKIDSSGQTIGPFINSIHEASEISCGVLRAFPNPTAGQTTLSFTSTIPLELRSVEVKLYDIMGKTFDVIYPDQIIQNFPFDVSLTIEVGKAQPGIYIVEVSDGKGVLGRSPLVIK